MSADGVCDACGELTLAVEFDVCDKCEKRICFYCIELHSEQMSCRRASPVESPAFVDNKVPIATKEQLLSEFAEFRDKHPLKQTRFTGKTRRVND